MLKYHSPYYFILVKTVHCLILVQFSFYSLNLKSAWCLLQEMLYAVLPGFLVVCTLNLKNKQTNYGYMYLSSTTCNHSGKLLMLNLLQNRNLRIANHPVYNFCFCLFVIVGRAGWIPLSYAVLCHTSFFCAAWYISCSTASCIS